MDQDFVAFLVECKLENCIADIISNGFLLKLTDPKWVSLLTDSAPVRKY